MYISRSSNTKYVHVYNTDSSTDESTTYKFTCYVSSHYLFDDISRNKSFTLVYIGNKKIDTIFTKNKILFITIELCCGFDYARHKCSNY